MLGTNYILENSQKLPPRVVGPLGASMLTHGWVRTLRTAQNLHNADIQWAERTTHTPESSCAICVRASMTLRKHARRLTRSKRPLAVSRCTALAQVGVD